MSGFYNSWSNFGRDSMMYDRGLIEFLMHGQISFRPTYGRIFIMLIKFYNVWSHFYYVW